MSYFLPLYRLRLSISGNRHMQPVVHHILFLSALTIDVYTKEIKKWDQLSFWPPHNMMAATTIVMVMYGAGYLL